MAFEKKVEKLLWVSLFLALVGSLWHLAAVFASLDGQVWLGWVQAVAVDVGVFALAYGVRVGGGRAVKAGLGLFVLISIYGNLLYGLGHAGTVWSWLAWLKPLVLAASLPVLVLFLAELLASGAGKDRAKAEMTGPEKGEKAKPSARVKKSKAATPTDKEARKAELLAVLTDDPNITKAAAYRQIGVVKSTGQSYFQELEADGLLIKNGQGWEVKG